MAFRLKLAGRRRPYRPIQPISRMRLPGSSRCQVRSAPWTLPTSNFGSRARAAVTPKPTLAVRLAGTNGTVTVAGTAGADGTPSTPMRKGDEPGAQPGPGVPAKSQDGRKIEAELFRISLLLIWLVIVTVAMIRSNNRL